jgi:hypothetical protein
MLLVLDICVSNLKTSQPSWDLATPIHDSAFYRQDSGSSGNPSNPRPCTLLKPKSICRYGRNKLPISLANVLLKKKHDHCSTFTSFFYKGDAQGDYWLN